MMKKLALFWNGFEWDPNLDLGYFRGRSVLLRTLILPSFPLAFPFGIVAPLALAGMLMIEDGARRSPCCACSS